MLDKAKHIFSLKKSENNDKKKIENLVVFIIILIATVLTIKAICKPDKDNNHEESNSNLSSSLSDNVETANLYTQDNFDNLEKRLEDILAKIQGVGNVNVMITLSQTSELIPLYNKNEKETATEEKDDTGGTRTISETENKQEVVYKELNGQKDIITQSVVKPKIEGAIVTAQGGDNADVKSSIIQAVEAVTGLPTHKIQVFKSNT